MDRKEFFEQSLKAGICTCAFMALPLDKSTGSVIQETNTPDDKCQNEKSFISNWLNDLLETMEKTVDRDTQVKIIEGCGKGCFNRHQFKKDIAIKGSGNLEKLIEAYSENFEIWKDDNKIHIRYGEKSDKCFCPVANIIPSKPSDLHCECTRSTHQTIFETALNRTFKVDIVESVRRGGKTCHFFVNL